MEEKISYVQKQDSHFCLVILSRLYYCLPLDIVAILKTSKTIDCYIKKHLSHLEQVNFSTKKSSYFMRIKTWLIIVLSVLFSVTVNAAEKKYSKYMLYSGGIVNKIETGKGTFTVSNEVGTPEIVLSGTFSQSDGFIQVNDATFKSSDGHIFYNCCVSYYPPKKKDREIVFSIKSLSSNKNGFLNSYDYLIEYIVKNLDNPGNHIIQFNEKFDKSRNVYKTHRYEISGLFTRNGNNIQCANAKVKLINNVTFTGQISFTPFYIDESSPLELCHGTFQGIDWRYNNTSKVIFKNGSYDKIFCSGVLDNTDGISHFEGDFNISTMSLLKGKETIEKPDGVAIAFYSSGIVDTFIAVIQHPVKYQIIAHNIGNKYKVSYKTHSNIYETLYNDSYTNTNSMIDSFYNLFQTDKILMGRWIKNDTCYVGTYSIKKQLKINGKDYNNNQEVDEWVKGKNRFTREQEEIKRQEFLALQEKKRQEAIAEKAKTEKQELEKVKVLIAKEKSKYAVKNKLVLSNLVGQTFHTVNLGMFNNSISFKSNNIAVFTIGGGTLPAEYSVLDNHNIILNGFTPIVLVDKNILLMKTGSKPVVFFNKNYRGEKNPDKVLANLIAYGIVSNVMGGTMNDNSNNSQEQYSFQREVYDFIKDGYLNSTISFANDNQLIITDSKDNCYCSLYVFYNGKVYLEDGTVFKFDENSNLILHKVKNEEINRMYRKRLPKTSTQ